MQDAPPPFDLAWHALKRWLPLDLLEEKVDAARRDLGRVNILVAGKTGVGKSTLINAVFGSRVSETGVGEPVTRKVAQYEPPGLPLSLWDTRGQETAAFQETLDAVEQAVKSAAASGRPEDRVHIAWVCIAEPGGRVEDADRQLAALCSRHGMPVVAVLTKAFGSQEFEVEVRRLLPGVDAVVPVMAEAYKVPPVGGRGLPDLVAETLRLLPAAARQAFVAAQLVDMAAKRRAVKRIAASAAAAAGAAATSPIPGTAPVAVLVVNAGMMTSIATAMGVPLGRPALIALGTSVAGGLAASTAGRMFLGEMLKFVPGVGSIVGAALDVGTTVATTYGLGVGFAEFLIAFGQSYARMPDADELRSGFQEFWAKRTTKVVEPPPDGD